MKPNWILGATQKFHVQQRLRCIASAKLTRLSKSDLFLTIIVNDYMHKRRIYNETPEETGRAEDYRLRLSPRKAKSYNTKFYHKNEAFRRFSIKNHLSAIYFEIYVPNALLYAEIDCF